MSDICWNFNNALTLGFEDMNLGFNTQVMLPPPHTPTTTPQSLDIDSFLYLFYFFFENIYFGKCLSKHVEKPKWVDTWWVVKWPNNR